jgi:hypothetical protein
LNFYFRADGDGAVELSLLERFRGDGEASTVRCDLQRVVRTIDIPGYAGQAWVSGALSMSAWVSRTNGTQIRHCLFLRNLLIGNF